MDILAMLDQMKAFLKDLSPVMWTYYEELKQKGFSDEQAFELTKEMQKSLIPGSKQN